jgi:hypothetical protein
MPPDKTIIINVDRKRLPFSTEFPFQATPDNFEEFCIALERALSSNKPFVVIDTFSAAVDFLYDHLFKHRASKKETFDMWEKYRSTLKQVFDRIRVKGKVVVLIGWEETLQDDDNKLYKTIGVQGKWKGRIETQFEMVLWCVPEKDGTVNFVTAPNGVCTAKSPMGMLDNPMDNDLFEVIKRVYNFYGYTK